MQSTFVFQGNDRWPTCHAGTICELKTGELVAAWFAGERESSDDSGILLSKWTGDQWTPPRVVVNVHKRAAGNPKLFIGPDGVLWLIAPVNYGAWCEGGTWLFVKRSFDHGETWTDLELLLQRPGILGKNKPIQLRSGVWLIPVEDEVASTPMFLRSEDQGVTWELVPVENDDWVIQPTVVELANGTLLAYCRSGSGAIYETRSKDEGRTWTKTQRTTLPNNNSGIDMVRLRSGLLVLVLNWVEPRDDDKWIKGVRWGRRTPLNLAVSPDEGKTWLPGPVLEDGPGEYSYPAIIQGSDGLIHVIYTHRRTAMKHVVLEEDELLD